jgi:hypothetical protein
MGRWAYVTFDLTNFWAMLVVCGLCYSTQTLLYVPYCLRTDNHPSQTAPCLCRVHQPPSALTREGVTSLQVLLLHLQRHGACCTVGPCFTVPFLCSLCGGRPACMERADAAVAGFTQATRNETNRMHEERPSAAASG